MASRERKTAVVIEDHPGQGLVFRTAFQQIGFRAELIQNGKLAEDRLKQMSPPDVVMIDLHMPGVGGDVLLEQIQADPRFAATKVIIASADEELADSLSDTVDLVLIKPIGFDQLKKRVTAFIDAADAD